MRRGSIQLVCSSVALGAAHIVVSVASAAPVITVTNPQRKVGVALSAEDDTEIGPFHKSLFDDIYAEADESLGPWTKSMIRELYGDGGSSGVGFAYQKSNVSTYVLSGEGAAEAWATSGTGGTAGSGSASSNFAYDFTVEEDSLFAATGEATLVADPRASVSVSVFIFGTKPGGGFLFESASFNSNDEGVDSPWQFFISESVQGATEVQFAVLGGATAEGDSHCRVDFDFQMNFGDADEDGLLDDWESNGIDIDDDGVAEIMLPGADPMRKNIYVEVDAMIGANVDRDAIADVVEAFRVAPVSNPDGSHGIDLHVNISNEDLDPINEMTGLEDLDTYKLDWWGDGCDDSTQNCEAVRDAWDSAYHYCIWGKELLDGTRKVTGQGEIPGNDFIVAADAVRRVSSNNRNGLAGTFMHELGHNLGLDHGGQDDENYKPNYISVMNYAYQTPIAGSESAFKLDYSRQELSPLNEAALDEQLGVDGPPDRNLMYNAAPDGATPIRKIIPSNKAPVDWNHMNGIEPGAVVQDISRIEPGQPASPNGFFKSYEDWGVLWLQLSGSDNYADGVARDPGDVPEELSEEQWMAIASTEVIDLTAPACLPDVTTTNTNPGDSGYGAPDGTVNGADLSYYVEQWVLLNADVADVTTTDTNPGDPGYGSPDGTVNGADLSYYVEQWLIGCP